MKKIIIDTDLGSDCDDVGALAIANILANHGKCEILAVTYTTSLIFGPLCISAVNRYYDHTYPIGVTARTDFFADESTSRYASKMIRQFYYDVNDLQGEAVSLLRRTLSKQKKGSVTMIFIGQLNNLSGLLDSSADQYSPLSGTELVHERVQEIVIMGGQFNNGKPVLFDGKLLMAEYNILSDLPSAQNAISKLPVLTTFVDFIIGLEVKMGAPLLVKKDLSNPVTFSYFHYGNAARESWDPIAVLYGIMGKDKYFSYSPLGKVFVRDSGETVFEASSFGHCRFLRLNVSPLEMTKTLDEIVIEK